MTVLLSVSRGIPHRASTHWFMPYALTWALWLNGVTRPPNVISCLLIDSPMRGFSFPLLARGGVGTVRSTAAGLGRHSTGYPPGASLFTRYNVNVPAQACQAAWYLYTARLAGRLDSEETGLT